MKKALSLLLVLMFSVLVLAACGSSGESSDGAGSTDESAQTEALDVDSLKTMGDVMTIEREESQEAVGNGKAVFAFKYGDTYYRVTAEISEDVQKAYMDVDITEEGYEEKQKEILAPIDVTSVENLSDQMLTQGELDALAGKTGQELVDEGWKYQGSYNFDEMEVLMEYGPFAYNVVFEGSVEGADQDDFDVEAATGDLKVRSAEYSMLGDGASDVD